MFANNNNCNMFATKRVYRAFPKPEGAAPDDDQAQLPPPTTKAESIKQNKKKYLPGEKLAIKLAKQNDKLKSHKPKSHSSRSLNNKQLSASLNRIISSLY